MGKRYEVRYANGTEGVLTEEEWAARSRNSGVEPIASFKVVNDDQPKQTPQQGVPQGQQQSGVTGLTQ